MKFKINVYEDSVIIDRLDRIIFKNVDHNITPEYLGEYITVYTLPTLKYKGLTAHGKVVDIKSNKYIELKKGWI